MVFRLERANVAVSAFAFASDVVAGIAAELGHGDDAASGLRNCVRANLRYLGKGARVLKDGKGPGATWRSAII